MLLRVVFALLIASVSAQDAETATEVAETTVSTRQSEDECCKCPEVTIQHYEAKSCKPVMDETVDPCCPSRYECQSEEERLIPLTKCLYKNVAYGVNETVPVEGPCRQACKCVNSIDKLEPVKIQCAVVECPALFSTPKPNCRPIFKETECCAVDEKCSPFIAADNTDEATTTVAPEETVPEEAAIPDVTCQVETQTNQGPGKVTYLEGDKMFFAAHPCQYCVCTKDYTGPFGPGCTKVDCGLEYRNRVYLRQGCTPLYVHGICCNVNWVCPDSPVVVQDPTLVATGEEDPTTHCTLGTQVVAKGEFLNINDTQVNCDCRVPPDVTCIHYPNPQYASEARKGLKCLP